MTDNAEALQEANKLIFVKNYAEASKILKSLIAGKPIDDDTFIYHLRRIELASKRGTAEKLIKEYQTSSLDEGGSEILTKVCELLVFLYGEINAPQSVALQFRDLLKSGDQHFAIYFGLGLAMEMEQKFEMALFNYSKSVELNPSWYPSLFGLSQVNYQLGDTASGDKNFYLFEKAAPYNVYGNFETHRKVSNYFLDKKMFDEAENAIGTLTSWWVEQKGSCPIEVQIYENLAIARINHQKGEEKLAKSKVNLAKYLSDELLDDEDCRGEVLYFVARVFEEFNVSDYSNLFLEKILSSRKVSIEHIQKIAADLLSRADLNESYQLIERSYRKNTESKELKFCFILCGLKKEGVDVESYISQKESIQTSLEANEFSVELLSSLHNMLAKYDRDPDIHKYIGDLYDRLGYPEKAGTHFKKMTELNNRSDESIKSLFFHFLRNDILDEAAELLPQITALENSGTPGSDEVEWLLGQYYSKAKDFKKAQKYMNNLLKLDPWNVSYLIQHACVLEELYKSKQGKKYAIDEVFEIILSDGDSSLLNWERFEEVNEETKRENQYQLLYLRSKIQFLYDEGNANALSKVVENAILFNPMLSALDFVSLLNTNYDSPSIYWALAKLYKESWQLEVSNYWITTALERGMSISNRLVASLMVIKADNYIWMQNKANEALETARMAHEVCEMDQLNEVYLVMAHAYLVNGQLKYANKYISHIDDNLNTDARYLKGLIKYRHGHIDKAKEIWKPLIIGPSYDVKTHHLKQNVMKYYYQNETYLKAN